MKHIMNTPTHSGRNIPAESWIEWLLRRFVPHKEIGWWDIGEVFFRYKFISTPWFNVYLHQLDAPNWHPVGCHDHPWWFVSLLLKSGYLERHGDSYVRHRTGSILYRPANWSHDVTTPYGRSWSLILTGPKVRKWGFQPCGEED